jgi:plastocyanin
MRTFPRPRLALAASLLLLTCAATSCGASSDEGPADAARVDAPSGPAAVAVRCPGTVAGEIDAINPNADNYIPRSRTIRAGQVIRFNTVGEHSARSRANLFEVNERSDTPCVQFNVPGTYEFFCLSHGFIGSIIVQ